MLAAASRYVCGRVQQHIAESSSTDLGGPGMSRRHADNAQGGLAGKPLKRLNTLSTRASRGRMRTGQCEDAANH